MTFFKSLIVCIIFSVNVHAGTTVPDAPKSLGVIKANASAAVNVPDLRDQVVILTDEVQKLKDALVKAGLIQAD